MSNVHVIYGGQFGSESKRLFTEYYCQVFKPDVIVTNALPNSGGFDSKNDKWSALPIGYPCKIMISPGSAIDPYNLQKEMSQLPKGAKVLIHQNAAVVTSEHCTGENSFVKVGSTMTGGAAAVMDKMKRDPDSKVLAKFNYETIGNWEWFHHLMAAERVLMICAQGHSLSLNFGFWPYCTSRNTSPAQVVADAGIPMQWVKRVIGCFRTFPIRVANRYGNDGLMIGYSGPGYEDQKEISWAEVGVPDEYTSVSKKVRRVFTFSEAQYVESIMMNGTTDVFLGFINYLKPEDQRKFVERLNELVPGSVGYIGYGKTIKDIVPAGDYTYDKTWIK